MRQVRQARHHPRDGLKTAGPAPDPRQGVEKTDGVWVCGPAEQFIDAGALDEGRMQALARQFNLSETTFLSRSSRATMAVTSHAGSQPCQAHSIGPRVLAISAQVVTH